MDFAETIRGIFGGQSSQAPPTGEDYASDLKPMVDPAARTRAVGGSPEFQGKVDETLRDALRETAEPFKQVGRAISGRSDNPVPEALLGGLGVATAIPGGIAKGALKAGAKLGGEALEDIIAPAAKKATTGGVEDMIKAYHGSPHDFERFDLSKIGTGEGAQAYGHGLYFAENEGVAKGYREALSKNQDGWVNTAKRLVREHTGAEIDDDAARSFLNATSQHKDDPVRAAKVAGWGSSALRGLDAEKLKDAAVALKGVQPGRMYEVGIRANPEHFLDWDKPLSEQHPKVQEAIEKVHPNAINSEAQRMRETLASLQAKYPTSDPMGQQAAIQRGLAKLEGGGGMRGQDLLQKLFMRPGGTEQGVSQALREAGIPGIKYLDQGSRDPVKMKELANDLAQYREAAKHWEATGNTEKLNIANKQIDVLSKRLRETRNYVVFDDKLIDILKKYGIAGIGALPAMNAFHYQDKQ